MALAIDASSPALATNAGTGLTVTTASFTPPAGSQLWAGSVSNETTGGETLTITSSPALTWTQRVLTNTQESPSIWAYANVVTSQAYTVTSTRVTPTFPGSSLYVVVVTGHEATPGGQTATANSNSGTPTVNITTTRDGSLILAAIGDWSAGGAGTAGTSQTILAEHHIGGDYTARYWRYDGFPVVGTRTINLTAPTGEDYNLSVVEVRAAAISGPVGRRRGIPAAILNR